MTVRALTRGELAKEAAISATINAVITLGFYFGMFHGLAAVPVWGIGGFAYDFLPQSFMVTLMGTAIPGMIWSRRRAGALARPLVVAVLARVLAFAVAALVLGSGAWLLVLWASGAAWIGFMPGLAIKIVYSVALSLVVTPAMLHRLPEVAR
ncbi:hypothetical protein [Sphingomonas sp.]|uniref:hypothetical protein n=1 Tax=Sphingomonas sp. TaxID=28214 RepID=UPI0031D070BB